MLSEQQQRIMGYFIEEAKDHLNTIEQGLINLQSTIADSEMVHEVFRAAHSVKGGAAMLGLNSIQHTAHRLEDYFKVLKECSQVRVDQKLETLFLRVYDTLQDQVDHLQGPFGLTDDKAQEAMAIVEPVFTELNQHLMLLVEQAGGTPPEDVELVSTPAIPAAQPQTPQPVVAEESALRFIFQNDVPARLREMLQLFKQAESSASREQLQDLCRALAQPGEQFNLTNWCELLKTVRRSIANTDNTYRSLAPVVIKDVKRAQELVLAGRSIEISACQELLNLLPPESLVEEQSLSSEQFDLLGLIDTDISDFAMADSGDSEFSTELFEEAENAEADWFTEMPTQEDTGEYSAGEPDSGELLLSNGHESELNFDLEFAQIASVANRSNDLDLSFIDQLDDEPLATGLGERNGPEVGTAELNSLADLFEGKLPDLGMTWQEEEVISAPASEPFPSQLENSGDFFDLLDQDNSDDLALDEAQDDDLSGLLNATALQFSTFEQTDEVILNSQSIAGKVSDGTEDGVYNDLPSGFGLAEPASSDEMAMFFFAEEQPSAPIAATPNGISDDPPSGFQNLDELFAGIEVDEFAAGDVELSDLAELSDQVMVEQQLTAFAEVATEADVNDRSNLSTEDNFADLLEGLEGSNNARSLAASSELYEIGLERSEVSIEDLIVEDDSLMIGDVSANLEELEQIELDITRDSTQEATEEIVESDLDFDFGDGDLFDPDLSFVNEETPSQTELDLTDSIVPFEVMSHAVESASELEEETTSDVAAFDELFAEDASNGVEQAEHEETEIRNKAEVQTDSDFLSTLSTIDEVSIIDMSSAELDDAEFDLDAALTEKSSFTAGFSESEKAFSEIEFEPIVDQFVENDGLSNVNSIVDTDVTEDIFELDSSGSKLELSEAIHLEAALEHESDELECDLFALEDTPESSKEGDSDKSSEVELWDGLLNGELDLEQELLESIEITASDLLEESETASQLVQDDFVDLGLFLEDAALNVVESGNGVVSGSSTSDILALNDGDFADLEAMLEDELDVSGSAVPLTIEDEGEISDETDDFADLEALLDDESQSSVPADSLSTTAPVVAAPATPKLDDEFGDLEALLQDADQKLGVGSSPVRSSVNTTNRRPARRNVIADQTMRVSVKHLDNLNNLVGEMVVNRNSLEQTQERLRQFLDNLLYQVQQLSDVGQRMRDLYERSLLESSLLASRRSYQLSGSNASAQTSHATGANFDALEMDKFTGFHTLSQEMIELIVRVRESASDIDFVVEESDQVTRNFRQITTQLQEGLTRSRMVPFAQTADRLPRGVRDNAIKYGKQAELTIEGRDTLIDKMIVEQLYDPMTHLVNNAIAHGIETPQERIASGKPPTGRITIRTFHQGNQTVISVSDDGAGIDTDAVKAKAVSKRLITAAESEQMSRLEAYDLLFHHGFSTAETVDDLRGRGVGLDVVRNNLSEIRGSISIDSAVGKGSTFTIRLPLTLSISKALCCISHRARIAFPMDGVEDMLDVPKDRVYADEQGQPCIQWRDTLLPFQPLSDLLKYNRVLGRGSVYGGNQEDDMLSIVVLRSAGNYLALQVDQVLGEQEIVIKQLEGPAPKPVGVAGATVLGDGRIMPIADVLELIDLSQGRLRREAGNALWETSGDQLSQDAVDLKTDPTVLIVDDSITVRELLSMTFNKVGYRVEQARDGQEAWEKLRSGLPCDLVFCDIEMPRMDGLELLSRLQKDPNLCHIPIAMLTSRGADRHRQMAVQLGAKGYFTKPYLEEMLLDAAQRMLKGEVLVTGTGN